MNKDIIFLEEEEVTFDGRNIATAKNIPVVKIDDDIYRFMYKNSFKLNDKFFNLIKNGSLYRTKSSKKDVTKTLFAITNGLLCTVIEINNENKICARMCDLIIDESRIYRFAQLKTSYVSDLLDMDYVDEKKKNKLYSMNELNLYLHIKGLDNPQENGFDLTMDVDQFVEELSQLINNVSKTNKPKQSDTTKQLKPFDCLTNMNEYVKENDINIIGFDKELDELTKGLLRIKKPNVMLLGAPGIGKTALVEKLACAINNKETYPCLWDKEVYEWSLPVAVAGTKYRGEFEKKIEDILNIVEKLPNVILFVDEAHTLIGAGGAEGAIDASNILKPALARGKIKLIGATTTDEYEDTIAKDKALARRFNNIEMFEPTYDEVTKILEGLRPKYEKHYGVTISDEELKIVHDSSVKSNRMMPDTAIDELEKYCVDKFCELSKECVK